MADISDTILATGGAPATDEATAALCKEAVYSLSLGLPDGPLAVSPLAAPADTLEPKVLEKLPDLREKIDKAVPALDADARAEASAHMDDYTLARFLIARDLKLEHAEDMFLSTMRWRAEKRVNALRQELHAEAKHSGPRSKLRHELVRTHSHAGFGGTARDGTPFFVENLGAFDVAAVDKDAEVCMWERGGFPTRIPQAAFPRARALRSTWRASSYYTLRASLSLQRQVFDLMMDGYITYLENAFSFVRLASAKSGAMQRATTIVDASGVSVSHASHVRVIKAVAKIGTSYYPEIMKRVLIVNAPWAAAVAWKMVAPFLPEQTRKKVSAHRVSLSYTHARTHARTHNYNSFSLTDRERDICKKSNTHDCARLPAF